MALFITSISDSKSHLIDEVLCEEDSEAGLWVDPYDEMLTENNFFEKIIIIILWVDPDNEVLTIGKKQLSPKNIIVDILW